LVAYSISNKREDVKRRVQKGIGGVGEKESIGGSEPGGKKTANAYLKKKASRGTLGFPNFGTGESQGALEGGETPWRASGRGGGVKETMRTSESTKSDPKEAARSYANSKTGEKMEGRRGGKRAKGIPKNWDPPIPPQVGTK